MIETFYPGNGDETGERIHSRSRKLPRNVRACGKRGGLFPVYIEDYVETYLQQLSDSVFPEYGVAVLTGRMMETEGGNGLFVHGAIELPEVRTEKGLQFGETVWSMAYEKMRMYFPQDEVVGWSIVGPGFQIQGQESALLHIHIDNFADSEKLFLMYESLEREETIRVCRNGQFSILPGYYIYYEKNDEMQNYMLDHKPILSKLSPEETHAEKNIKKRSAEKKEDINKKNKKSTLMKEKESQNEKSQIKESGSGKKARMEVLQLGAMAGMVVLIIAVLVGVDVIRGLQKNDSADGQNNQGDQITQPTSDAGELAFGDFGFLNGSETENTKINETENDYNASSDSETESSEKSKAVMSDGNEDSAIYEEAGNDNSSLNESEKTSGTEDLDSPVTADNKENDSGEAAGGKTAGGETDSKEAISGKTAGGEADSGEAAGGETSNEKTTNVSENSVISEETDTKKQMTESEETVAAVSYEYYYVKAGDTLASICSAFYGSTDRLEEISELNQVDNIDRIYIGQELVLPKN